MKTQLEQYCAAMRRGIDEICIQIELETGLIGYTPQLVTIGLAAIQEGKDPFDAIDSYGAAMNDKELLRQAGKAIGIKLVFEPKGPVWVGEYGEWPVWNPLSDDGDALRLAVKLGLTVAKWGDPQNSAVSFLPGNYAVSSEPISPDPFEATRRSIVRAAAEIGRTMP